MRRDKMMNDDEKIEGKKVRRDGMMNKSEIRNSKFESPRRGHLKLMLLFIKIKYGPQKENESR